VARAQGFVTIGIDAEPNKRLPDGVLDTIASVEELEWLQSCMHDASTVCWDRLLFSIKEAVYKAWFPLASRKLGFEDASIVIDRSHKEFSAQLQIAGCALEGIEPSSFSGRWLVHGGLVVTAVALSKT
jgi:4'-phosphopantetheinyl transferase EntD